MDPKDELEDRPRSSDQPPIPPMPAPADSWPMEPRPHILRRWWKVITTVAAAAIGVLAYFHIQDGLKLLPQHPTGESRGVAGFPGVSIPAPPPGASVVPVPPHQRDIPATARAGEKVDIADNNRALTTICDGGSVTISGTENTVLVTGNCLRVDVGGDRNVLRITSSPTITVSGEDNHVTYYSSVPEVTDTGFGNTVGPA